MPSFFLLVRFLSLPAKQRKKMNVRKERLTMKVGTDAEINSA